MKKLLKIIAVLLVLIIAVALAAPYFISADSFKGQIIEKVQTLTGRTLTIDGKLQLTFFPSVGVSAENVTLSNPKEFDDKTPFISLKALNISVATLPLLSKQIEIKTFMLDEPKINLHVNKNGVKNWEFAPMEKASDEAKPATTATPSTPLPLLLLGDVNIKNGFVSFVDEVQKTKQTVSQLNTRIAMKSLDAPFNASGSGEWNGKNVKLNLDVSALQALINHTRADIALDTSSDLFAVEAKGVLDKDIFTGKAHISSQSLKELMTWANPAAKPLATPARLALDVASDVSCGAANCSLSGMSLSLDAMKATGSAKAAFGAKPSVDLDIATGVLDLNAFLPPEKHAANGVLISSAYAASGHWSDDAIDLSGLNAINLNATIKTDGVVFRKIKIGKTPLVAKLQNGHLSLAVSDAELYSGKGSVTIAADTNGAYQMNATLKGVQLEPLFTDAAITDKFSGAADIQMNLTSHGASQEAIISALSGSGSVKVNDGVLKGVDLGNVLRSVSSVAQKGSSGQKTAFSDLSATFSIAQGVLSNKDLSMKTEGVTVAGQGTVNLPAYTINYRLTPQMVGVAKNADGTTKQAGGVAVPVLVSGSLDAPSYQPDVGAVLQEAIKDPKKLREQLKNSERSIKEQLKDPKKSTQDLKGLLKGFR